MNAGVSNWLGRAAAGLRSLAAGSAEAVEAPPSPAAPGGVDAAGAVPAADTPAWMHKHAAKRLGAAEAAALVRHGEHVFVGTGCATPRVLVRALEAVEPRQGDVQLVHLLTDGALPHDADGTCTSHYRHRCFFVGNDVGAAVRQGLCEYVPLSAARLPQLIANGRVRVDVAMIQVSPPDEFGYVSLGVSVDVIPAAVAKARLVLAEINPAMPRSMGDSALHIDDIDHWVPVPAQVIEHFQPAAQGDVVQAIARYISSIIDDGSTLHIGLGRFSTAALALLDDRKDLGVHSDVITDAIVPLLERGVLTGRMKSQHRGKIVASFARGSRRLYALIDRNPLFVFQPLDVVCDPAVLAAQHKLVSVTQAFSVDLTGQVCVDQLDGVLYSGLMAQPEFLQGASRSAGGKAIICLASTTADGLRSQVKLALADGEAAGIARSDVHYVITEYGIAYLFGKSIRERAAALIDLAHPKFRAELLGAAQARGWLPAEQQLKHLHAYPVADERRVVLGDGQALLLRPALGTDDVAVRELFHHLSEGDVYTRFFRKVKGLSDRDAQRLCNLNLETEVAFVAVVGTREQAQVVGHACYFVDAATRIAETAFMVDPQWQGKGLGAALQQRLLEHARSRGVQGFVAEILATNDKMIRLARAGQGDVSVVSEGSVVRMTTMFR
jgi:acyl-CoA hydrolase/L-amino acid N-acyltransferase YncA